jgi:hypothetical protein
VWFNWVVVANLFTVYKTVICFLKKTREKEERVVGCLFVNGQSGSSFIQIPKPGRPVFIVTGDWETSGVELLVHTVYIFQKQKTKK